MILKIVYIIWNIKTVAISKNFTFSSHLGYMKWTGVYFSSEKFGYIKNRLFVEVLKLWPHLNDQVLLKSYL